jgi:hypothetical protein
MDFVRKFSWRFIALLIAGLTALAFTPLSVIGAKTDQLAVRQYSIALLICLFVGFFFKRLKWIQHIDTWLHEFGHAATVAMFGGIPKSIKLNQNSSGATSFAHSRLTPFRDLIISAAGPMGSMFTLLIGSMLVFKGQEVLLIGVVGFLVFLLLVSTVRTPFGWMVGILIWLSMAFTYSVKAGLIATIQFPYALDIYLGGFLGLASGVALRAALQRIRFHSVHGDEGKIAQHLHLPEVIVDWALVLLNAVLMFGILQYLDVGQAVAYLGDAYPDAKAKFDQLVEWFRTIPIFN